jgi:hypothetical protein
MKPTIFTLLLSGALFLLTMPCGFAEEVRAVGDWEYLSTDVMQNKFYVDKNSIQREGDIIRYREKIMYGPQLRVDLSTLSGYPVFADIRNSQVNCKDKMLTRSMLQPYLPEPGSEDEAGVKDLCAGGPKFKPNPLSSSPAEALPNP